MEMIHTMHYINNVLQIKNIDSGNVYDVDLLSACPNCSCPDWCKFHLPCNHNLAIFQHYPSWDWDFLSTEFIDAPHFNLNHDIRHQRKRNQISDATEVPDKVFPGTHTCSNKNMCKTKKLEVQEEATLPNIKECKLCRELLKTIQSSLMNVSGQNIRTVYNQLQPVAETLKGIQQKKLIYTKNLRKKRIMSQQVSFFMEITSSLMSILEPTCFIVYQLHIDLAMHCLNMK